MDTPATTESTPPTLDALDPAAEQARLDASRGNLGKVLAALDKLKADLETQQGSASVELRHLNDEKNDGGVFRLRSKAFQAEKMRRGMEDEVERVNGEIRALEMVIAGLKHGEQTSSLAGEIESMRVRLTDLAKELAGEEHAEAVQRGETIKPTEAGGVIKRIRDITLILGTITRSQANKSSGVLGLEADGKTEGDAEYDAAKAELDEITAILTAANAEKNGLLAAKTNLEREITKLQENIRQIEQKLLQEGDVTKDLEEQLRLLKEIRLPQAKQAVNIAGEEELKAKVAFDSTNEKQQAIERKVTDLGSSLAQLVARREGLEKISGLFDRVEKAKTDLPNAVSGIRGFKDSLSGPDGLATKLATEVFQRLGEVRGRVNHTLEVWRRECDLSVEELGTALGNLNALQQQIDQALVAFTSKKVPDEADLVALLGDTDALEQFLGKEWDKVRSSDTAVAELREEALLEVRATMEPLRVLNARVTGDAATPESPEPQLKKK